MAFKSFKNNGVLIKPELTDDWVMSFEYSGGMKVSSKKLDVNITISNSNVKFFMDKLIRNILSFSAWILVLLILNRQSN